MVALEKGLPKGGTMSTRLGHRTKMNLRRIALISIFFATCSILSAQQPGTSGPEIGSTVPSFEAPDQNGHVQSLKSIGGPKGALLVFFKSADF